MNKTLTIKQRAEGLANLLRDRQADIDSGARAGTLTEGEGTSLFGQAADVITELLRTDPIASQFHDAEALADRRATNDAAARESWVRQVAGRGDEGKTYLPTARDEAAFDAVCEAASHACSTADPAAVLAAAIPLAPDAGLTLKEVIDIFDSWVEIGEWEKLDDGTYRAMPGAILGVPIDHGQMGNPNTAPFFMRWHSTNMEPTIPFGAEVCVTPTKGLIESDGLYLLETDRSNIQPRSLRVLCAPVLRVIWRIERVGEGQFALTCDDPGHVEMNSTIYEASLLSMWRVVGKVAVVQNKEMEA